MVFTTLWGALVEEHLVLGPSVTPWNSLKSSCRDGPMMYHRKSHVPQPWVPPFSGFPGLIFPLLDGTIYLFCFFALVCILHVPFRQSKATCFQGVEYEAGQHPATGKAKGVESQALAAQRARPAAGARRSRSWKPQAPLYEGSPQRKGSCICKQTYLLTKLPV